MLEYGIELCCRLGLGGFGQLNAQDLIELTKEEGSCEVNLRGEICKWIS
jgi:hypothetical protein